VTAPVFVDTSIFLCALQTGEPAKQALAARWLERLWKEQRGRTSMQVLSECYVNLTREIVPALEPDSAWLYVQSLLKWQPQPSDAGILQRAHEIERRHGLDSWDSLIVAAAQAQNCILLLSEALAHNAVYGTVTVRNPFAAQASADMTADTTAAIEERSYRARGRPRSKKERPAH